MKKLLLSMTLVVLSAVMCTGTQLNAHAANQYTIYCKHEDQNILGEANLHGKASVLFDVEDSGKYVVSGLAEGASVGVYTHTGTQTVFPTIYLGEFIKRVTNGSVVELLGEGSRRYFLRQPDNFGGKSAGIYFQLVTE